MRDVKTTTTTVMDDSDGESNLQRDEPCMRNKRLSCVITGEFAFVDELPDAD